MSKSGLLLFALICLFVGMMIGKPNGNSLNITQDEIDKFEDLIENGEYEPVYQNIEPNSIGKIGQRFGDMIDKVFDGLFN